jgi:hypothetical protein
VAQTHEYKLIQGNGVQVDGQLKPLVLQGWKPILMSCCVGADPRSQVQTVIVLEHALGG